MQADQQDRINPQDPSTKSNNLAITAIAVVIIISIGAYQLITAETKVEPVEPTRVAVQLPDPAPAEPLPTEVDLPEPETAIVEPEVITQPEPVAVVTEPIQEVVQPLPALNESDAYVHDQAVKVANGMTISPFITKQNLARRFVVFVDNMAQGELARKVSPLVGPKQAFSVADITNKTYLNPDSFHRYDMYADLLTGIDPEQLAATYQELMPLLNEALTELGYEDDEFTSRLIQAIDVMLDAPIIEDPIELDGVSVNYQFVDPELEALPSAHKLLIRMGPTNSRKVKTALKSIKALLNK